MSVKEELTRIGFMLAPCPNCGHETVQYYELYSHSRHFRSCSECDFSVGYEG